MKIVQHKFNAGIRLYNLGDIHRGNSNCDEDFLHKVIGMIAGDDHAYWVSTGDMLEVATKHSVGNVHNSISAEKELDILTDELMPIRNKCLGFVASNHHNRVNKETGLSLDRAVASQVGLPYLGITGILNLTIGRGSYYIHLHHGTGGGTVGNAINRALKGASIYKGADVYMSGHTHKMTSNPFTQQIIDRKRGIIRSMKSHMVITGHCLIWEDSYAESMQLDPAPIGFAYVEFGLNVNGNESNKSIRPDFVTN